MSNNVRDELTCRFVYGPIGYATAYEMTAAFFAYLAERGMVVLGPDGEPIDVRPALRALGLDARNIHEHALELFGHSDIRHCARRLAPGPLADACLAAAEVKP